MKNELKLIAMSDIPSEQVQWLWYPYIPLGKLTIVQGDQPVVLETERTDLFFVPVILI